MCDCQSYNLPDLGGGKPEVVLDHPDRPNGICVDACIAHVIRYLWAAGVETIGCCCGHNRTPPSVVLANHQDPSGVRDIIAAVDDREWEIFQWRLQLLPVDETS